MHNDQTPHPHLPPISAPGRLNRGSKAIVRRARLEHLAAEFLRLGDALRLPVPSSASMKIRRCACGRSTIQRKPSIYVTASEDNLAKAPARNRPRIARLLGRIGLGDADQTAGRKAFFAGRSRSICPGDPAADQPCWPESASGSARRPAWRSSSRFPTPSRRAPNRTRLCACRRARRRYLRANALRQPAHATGTASWM